ncbi:RHOQ isoform 6, partial [Pan troglodytes]
GGKQYLLGLYDTAGQEDTGELAVRSCDFDKSIF